MGLDKRGVVTSAPVLGERWRMLVIMKEGRLKRPGEVASGCVRGNRGMEGEGGWHAIVVSLLTELL